MISSLHGAKVFPRRQSVLSTFLAGLMPANSRVLDVGSGDGSIALLVQNRTQGVTMKGIDVLIRPQTAIPVEKFDGVKIPYEDGSFDGVMFVDVLHHTPDPQVLLNEAARVASKFVVIKDHHRNGFLAYSTLRFMDWVGNAHHGVALPYNYWSQAQWEAGYAKAGLKLGKRLTKLGLYPAWANWLFGRSLHSIVLLEKI